MDVLSSRDICRAVTLFLVLWIHPAVAQTGYEEGITLFNAAKYAQAHAFFEARRSAFENDADFQYYHALGLLITGSDKQALEVMERAVELAPANTDYLYALTRIVEVRANKVNIVTATGLIRKYKATLGNIIELDPGHVKASGDLAELLLGWPGVMGGDKDAGRDLLATLRKLDPAAALMTEAITLQEGDDRFQQEESLLLQAIAIPESSAALSARIRLGRLYVVNGHYRQAIPVLEEAMAMPWTWSAKYKPFMAPMLMAAAYYHLDDSENFQTFSIRADAASQLMGAQKSMRGWFKQLDVDY